MLTIEANRCYRTAVLLTSRITHNIFAVWARVNRTYRRSFMGEVGTNFPDEATTDWTQAAQDATRERLTGDGAFPTLGGKVHLKHRGSDFGYITADDLRRGVLKVVNKTGTAEAIYADADGLVRAG